MDDLAASLGRELDHDQHRGPELLSSTATRSQACPHCSARLPLPLRLLPRHKSRLLMRIICSK